MQLPDNRNADGAPDGKSSVVRPILGCPILE